MILVVLDTNILASGALTSSTIPGYILNKWRSGQFELVISLYIIAELGRTFNKPYFRSKISAHTTEAFLDLLRNEAMLVSITTPIPHIATHPEDDLVLATAESGKAQYIVTGDHGLQNLKKFKNIIIISPKDFTEIIRSPL